jgi:hypothetical protein
MKQFESYVLHVLQAGVILSLESQVFPALGVEGDLSLEIRAIYLAYRGV